MDGIKQRVSQIIAYYYLILVFILSAQGRNIEGGNILLMFPFGILMPKAYVVFRKKALVISSGLVLCVLLGIMRVAAGAEIHIFFSVFWGVLGTAMGYAGYCICEKCEKMEHII